MKTEIIPVIHVINEDQAFNNIYLCNDLGIFKVFLISHRGDNEGLIKLAHKVKFELPGVWVGVNLLGVPTIEALIMPELNGLDAIWADTTITAEMVKKRTFKGQFFGGLAFKYQRDANDISKETCDEAKLATDVATTSGAGTGQAANMNKINTIREHLGEHPMAIASGVDAENIKEYAGIVDYLLVASSITGKGEMIISDKLQELINSNTKD